MNIPGSFYVGWRYLQRHRVKITLLVATITLSLVLPVGIFRLVQQAEHHLRSRSADTPLLLGATGSPLELVFNGIYFSEPEVDVLPSATIDTVEADRLAWAIPIHARFDARGYPIVGTALDYFEFRGLTAQSGTLFVRLGDCVLGAAVAEDLGLAPGDSIISTPEQVFDLTGVYPLKMRISGVLAPTGSMDDRAVFVDLKTAWIIEGLAHGHDDVQEDDSLVLSRDKGNVSLNASVVEFTEVTDHNISTFHFHGEPADFPITAAIVIPKDAKAQTILLGRYLGENRTAQLIRPDDVMANLFATIFRVRDLVVAALAATGLMAAGIVGLVFLLSNQLRRGEFESLANLGADRGSVRLLLGFEALFVVVTSLLLSTALIILLDLTLHRVLPLLT